MGKGQKTIPVREATFSELKAAKNAHGGTWDDFLRALYEDGEVVNGADPDVVAERVVQKLADAGVSA